MTDVQNDGPYQLHYGYFWWRGNENSEGKEYCEIRPRSDGAVSLVGA